ncbi:PAS domain-containing protein [Podospora conica]|nr:PAS domain-containing protein [Schizothecium conicum]
MNNYYQNPLSPEEMQRRMASQQQQQQRQQNPGHGHGRPVSMINTGAQPTLHAADPLSAMSDVSMAGGDSLDAIIRQNAHAHDLQQRRNSVPQNFAQMGPDGIDRRMSMMEYGPGDNAFADFGFANMMSPADAMVGGGYGSMADSMGMAGHSGAFAQPNLMAMSDQPDYSSIPISPDMMGNMIDFSNLNVGSMGADPNHMNLFSAPMAGQYPPATLGPINTQFGMDMNMENSPDSATSTNAGADASEKPDDEIMTVDGDFDQSDEAPPRQSHRSMEAGMVPYNSSLRPPMQPERSGSGGFQSPAAPISRALSRSGGPQTSGGILESAPMTPASTGTGTPMGPAPAQKSIYSRSGFDMLRALWHVATRPNPKLNIGAVDFSCAFVVCDVTLNDCPIIYVSDNFQNLTGYNRHEIIGKNCRFLQAPDGKVEAGTERQYVENHAVYNLKEAIAKGDEIQQSIINYRKGGKPFLNLLTMIPIPWDGDDVRFIVGFQIDLVECPDAISGQDTNGAMTVDYQKSVDINKYVWNPPNQSQWDENSGQTLGIDDVSSLLQSFNPKASSDWHKQSWDKMLLENADDVIHVLSLKGNFQYLSPSCKKILEYDAHELVNETLSSICHPSDIVPVMRLLKEAQTDKPVDTVYRIRRKHSGYTWFESYGILSTEPGKGKKCIILVGRKRPVFSLRRSDLMANGGIGDSEIWTKVSTSGMFLFVSSNVKSLLELERDQLFGTSMQDLMRRDSRVDFGRTIEKARQGKIVSCKHDIIHKRGQVLQAHTTFYPGDVGEGEKPTFLLAQTKLIKASARAIAPATGARAGMGLDDPLAAGRPSSDRGRPSDQSHSPADSESATVRDPHENIFEQLSGTRCTSWQYELRQMEKTNRALAEELARLVSSKKKRKRRKGGSLVRDCANCHTRSTPEWRRGPSGQRDLCNSCGLRWAKQTGRVSPRNSSRGGNGNGNGDASSKKSNSPIHSSPLHREVTEPGGGGGGGDPPAVAASTTSTEDSTATTTPPGGGGNVGPPQSRPMLEGGSGHGGSGMEMTAIQEERETNP